LHVTDIHFNRKTFASITENQGAADVICLTGDFLDQSIKAPLEINKQILWINNWLSQIEKPIFLCSGNHDVVDDDLGLLTLESLFDLDDTAVTNPLQWLKDLKKQNVFIDDDIKEVNGVTFGCMAYESENFEKFKSCDVLLTHVPPKGTHVALGEFGDFGCELLKLALKNGTISPKMLLCGHIHNPKKRMVKFGNTTLYNPGFNSMKNGINSSVIVCK